MPSHTKSERAKKSSTKRNNPATISKRGTAFAKGRALSASNPRRKKRT